MNNSAKEKNNKKDVISDFDPDMSYEAVQETEIEMQSKWHTWVISHFGLKFRG